MSAGKLMVARTAAGCALIFPLCLMPLVTVHASPIGSPRFTIAVKRAKFNSCVRGRCAVCGGSPCGIAGDFGGPNPGFAMAAT